MLRRHAAPPVQITEYGVALDGDGQAQICRFLVQFSVATGTFCAAAAQRSVRRDQLAAANWTSWRAAIRPLTAAASRLRGTGTGHWPAVSQPARLRLGWRRPYCGDRYRDGGRGRPTEMCSRPVSCTSSRPRNRIGLLPCPRRIGRSPRRGRRPTRLGRAAVSRPRRLRRARQTGVLDLPQPGPPPHPRGRGAVGRCCIRSSQRQAERV